MNTTDNISVITICFNNPEELRNTLDSLNSQSVPPFEHLIIDGSSNDAICKLLQEDIYKKTWRRSVHEKDNGISDAFNKGIVQSKGDWILMLNAGDRFFDNDSLKSLQNVITSKENINWLHAKYQLTRGGIDVVIGKPHDPAKVYRGMRSICHQTMLVNRSLYEKYGLYDTSLKFGMDYDFLLRIKDEPFYFLPAPIIRYDTTGLSSVNYLESLKQTGNIYRKQFGNSIKQRLWSFRLRTLHLLLHSPIGKVLYRIKTVLRMENI